jgi:hypothetical protein
MALLQGAFFPVVTRGAVMRATAASGMQSLDSDQIRKLPPRDKSLVKRAKDIMSAYKAAVAAGRAFNSGGTLGEDAKTRIISLGEYLIKVQAASADFKRAFRGEAEETPAEYTFPSGGEAVQVKRAPMSPLSTAQSQAAIARQIRRDQTPTVTRPEGGDFGGSEVDRKSHATYAERLRQILLDHPNVVIDVRDAEGHERKTPLGEMTLSDTDAALAAGKLQTDRALETALRAVLENVAYAVKDLFVRRARNRAGADPAAQERAGAAALQQSEAYAASISLEDAPVLIQRMLSAIAKPGVRATPPAPSPAPATNPAPETEAEETASSGRPLTPEAEDLIRAVESGGIPSMGITKSMVNIALANGIGEDQIDNLRAMDDTTLAVKALVRLLKLKASR